MKSLNNVIEADHGKLKLLIRPVRGFKTHQNLLESGSDRRRDWRGDRGMADELQVGQVCRRRGDVVVD